MKIFGIYKVLQWVNSKRTLSNQVGPNLQLDKGTKGDDEQSIINANPPRTRTIRIEENNGIGFRRMSTLDDGEFHTGQMSIKRRKKSTKASHQLRIQKVISGIEGIENKRIDEIKDGIKQQAKSLLKFLAGFIFYACLGGVIFFYIEECSGWGNAGDRSVPQLGNAYYDATFKNITYSCWQLFQNAFNETLNNTLNWRFDVFEPFCENVLKSSTDKFVVEGRVTKCSWDEFMLLKYAEYTIFTLLTIGYGNTTPVTTCGRCLAIIYSIIGVPIAVSMYSIAGKLLSQVLTLLVKRFNKKFTRKTLSPKFVQWEVLWTSVISVVLIMLIGCSITTRGDMEGWNFSSSVYFWFISLTTIGYGDLHFDRDRHLANPHLLLISASLLLFGLGMVAAVIESFALALEKTTVDEEDESDDKGYIDFEDHGRVTMFVLSTVTVGAGLLMESSFYTSLQNDEQIDQRKPALKRRQSFIEHAARFKNVEPTSTQTIIEELDDEDNVDELV